MVYPQASVQTSQGGTLAALHAAGPAAPGRPGGSTGTAAVGDGAALVAPCGGGGVRDRRYDHHREGCTVSPCDVVPRRCHFGTTEALISLYHRLHHPPAI